MPLKASDRGKSRIEVDPSLRRQLVLAMALDTVAAAVAAEGVREVVVVVDEPADADQLTRFSGVRVVRTHASELNQAIVDGARALVGDADDPRRSGPVAVLPGDLPSLLPDELAVALSAAATHPLAVVADKQGTGTTLLAAAAVSLLHPRYGSGSLGRHLADGAVRLDLPVDSGLRRDVDHLADLPDVTGPRTVSVLERAGFARERCASRPAV